MKTIFLLTVLLTIVPGEASAQSGGVFIVSIATIGGGGGQTSGGSFSLNGTVGRPDAGAMSGGGFTITGGFWSDVISEPLPRLAIRRTGAEVVLSWPNPSTGYQLQQTSASGWLDLMQTPVVVGSDKEVTLPINTPYRFFRLHRP